MDSRQRFIKETVQRFEAAAKELAMRQTLGPDNQPQDMSALLKTAGLPDKEVTSLVRNESILKDLARQMSIGVNSSSLRLVESVVGVLILHKVEALNLPAGPAIAAGVALIVAHYGIQALCSKWTGDPKQENKA